MKSIKRELCTLLRRKDILRAALCVGKIEDPSLKVGEYTERVLGLASGVWHKIGKYKEDYVLQIEFLNRALFDEFGLMGRGERAKNVIDDPGRFYLHHVLEKKLGSPLSLSILYCALCQQLGIPYECIALPSGYFVRILDPVSDFFVEPYDSGKILSQDSFQKKFKLVAQSHRILSTSLYERVGVGSLVGFLTSVVTKGFVMAVMIAIFVFFVR